MKNKIKAMLLTLTLGTYNIQFAPEAFETIEDTSETTDETTDPTNTPAENNQTVLADTYSNTPIDAVVFNAPVKISTNNDASQMYTTGDSFDDLDSYNNNNQKSSAIESFNQIVEANNTAQKNYNDYKSTENLNRLIETLNSLDTAYKNMHKKYDASQQKTLTAEKNYNNDQSLMNDSLLKQAKEAEQEMYNEIKEMYDNYTEALVDYNTSTNPKITYEYAKNNFQTAFDARSNADVQLLNAYEICANTPNLENALRVQEASEAYYSALLSEVAAADQAFKTAQENYNTNNSDDNASLLEDARYNKVDAENLMKDFNNPVAVAVVASKAFETAQEIYNQNPTEQNKLALDEAQKSQEEALQKIDSSGGIETLRNEQIELMNIALNQRIQFEKIYQDLLNNASEQLAQAKESAQIASDRYQEDKSEINTLATLQADQLVESLTTSINALIESYDNNIDSTLNNMEQSENSIADSVANTINVRVSTEGITAWEAFKEWVVALFTNPSMANSSWKTFWDCVKRIQTQVGETVSELKTDAVTSETNNNSLVSKAEVLEAIEKLNELGANLTTEYSLTDLKESVPFTKITRASEWNDMYTSYKTLDAALSQEVETHTIVDGFK